MTTKLVSDYEKKDADFDAFAEDITGELNERLSEKIAETEFDLVISDENGNWIIRNGETNLGNLVVDSYRYAMGTDIRHLMAPMSCHMTILKILQRSEISLWRHSGA